ncbi:MAG: hypothetical protein O9248_00910, partial [Rhodobacteraceae bacterium]|nr:hypothetical protein [Paracoccaceae bacterium]
MARHRTGKRGLIDEKRAGGGGKGKRHGAAFEGCSPQHDRNGLPILYPAKGKISAMPLPTEVPMTPD